MINEKVNKIKISKLQLLSHGGHRKVDWQEGHYPQEEDPGLSGLLSPSQKPMVRRELDWKSLAILFSHQGILAWVPHHKTSQCFFKKKLEILLTL